MFDMTQDHMHKFFVTICINVILNLMNYKILIYERIDVLEGINFDKTGKSKECIICNYWFFKNENFNFEKPVCNGSHDISVICYELKHLQYLKQKVLITDVFYEK